MSRPGFITILDKDSPPMMFNAGDGFHYEKLPDGTRVIYPPGPSSRSPTPVSLSSGRSWNRWIWSRYMIFCAPG